METSTHLLKFIQEMYLFYFVQENYSILRKLLYVLFLDIKTNSTYHNW